MTTPKIIYFIRTHSRSTDIEKGAVVKETPTGYKIRMGKNQTYLVSRSQYEIFTDFEEVRTYALDRTARLWKEAKDQVAAMNARTRELEGLQVEKYGFTWGSGLNG